MLARALSGTVFGLDGVRVEVEADIADGLPGFHIVGLGDRALQEARERVKIAINNSGFEFPGRRVTVNLAPAQLPKEGTGFDLAIAAAVVNAAGDRPLPSDAAWLGELALDGAVRPIRGTLAITAHLDRLGVRRFYVPTANVAEARIATTAPVLGVDHLRDLKAHWEAGGRLEEVEDLVRVGSEAGLDAAELRDAIETDRYAAVIDENRRIASSVGIDAIPAHIFGRRYLVLGAQPYEVLKQVVDRLRDTA